MSSFDDTPIIGQPPGKAPLNSFDATPIIGQAPTVSHPLQPYESPLENALGSLGYEAGQAGQAFEHNFFKPFHNAAMAVEHGATSLAQKLPDNPVTRAMVAGTESDRQALAADEAAYQARVPNGIAANTGAVYGTVAPYVLGIGGALGRVGAASKDILLDAIPNASKLGQSVVSGIIQGAAAAPFVTSGTSQNYGADYERNTKLGMALGAILPIAAAPFKYAWESLKPTFSPQSRVAETARILRESAPESHYDNPQVTAPQELSVQGSVPVSTAGIPNAQYVQQQAPIAKPPVNFPAELTPNADGTLPGFKRTVAQTYGGSDLIAAEKTLRNDQATRSIFDAQDAANNQLHWDVLNRFKADDTQLAAMKAARDAQMTPLRAQVLQAPVDAKPILDQLNSIRTGAAGTDPVVKRAVTNLASNIQEGIDNTGAGGTLIGPDLLDGFRQNLRNIIRDNASGSIVGSKQEAALIPVKNMITDSIESANPGYKNYLQQYGKASAPINSAETANGVVDYFKNRGFDVNQNPKIELTGFNTALNRAMNTEHGFTPEAQAAFQGIQKDLQVASTSNALRSAGSDTVYNLTAPNWLQSHLYGKDMAGGGTLSKAAHYVPLPIGPGLLSPGPKMNEMLAKALADPEVFSQITGQAPSQNLNRLGAALMAGQSAQNR